MNEALAGALGAWPALADWMSYRPSDFLMFAPRTYWRLFELHNEAWWPLPLWLPALGLATVAWWGRGGALARRFAAGGLAVASAFVAFAFVAHRYAPINWAAIWLAWLFAVQAALLIGLALAAPLRAAAGRWRRRCALILALWAMLGHPLLALLAQRPLAQAEVFGLAPDPTGLATLAWLLLGSASAASTAVRWAWRGAWAIALAQCAISAATLATMREPQAALMLAAGAAAVAAVIAETRARAG